MTQTIFGLLRHGQTDWNVDGRLQGTSDIPLNEHGIFQAQQAALKVNPADWDAVAASPLDRAIATARFIAAPLGISEVTIEPLLTERAFGEAEGWTYLEWRDRHLPDVPLPGEESLEKLELRAHALLARILEIYAGKRVLAVSHGAMIRKIIRVVSGDTLPTEGQRIANTSLTVLRHDGAGWSVHHFDGRPLGEID